MKRTQIRIASACAVIFAATALCGCKGRTMENMEPTGDTVEVEVKIPAVDTTQMPIGPA